MHGAPPPGSKAAYTTSPAAEGAASRPDVGPESQQERPGLGTVFGEERHAPVQRVDFTRAAEAPVYTAALNYNDRAGVEALRRRMEEPAADRGEPARWRPLSRSGLELGGVTVRLVGEDGAALPAYYVGERVLVVGQEGQRYELVVDNHTGRTYEVVASVDGLDVVDGQPASLRKRGYVLGARDRLQIAGFRRSTAAVAAFRFGSVRDSYAARSAEFGDRHVGVIGVALFAEAGAPEPDLDREALRRQVADPFPGTFAQPPR